MAQATLRRCMVLLLALGACTAAAFTWSPPVKASMSCGPTNVAAGGYIWCGPQPGAWYSIVRSRTASGDYGQSSVCGRLWFPYAGGWNSPYTCDNIAGGWVQIAPDRTSSTDGYVQAINNHPYNHYISSEIWG